MSISVVGTVVNPKIFIIQDNEIKYFIKIKKTCTDLFITNRDTVATDANDRFIVRDAGVNISSYRQETQGG
jgi:hypothetical protein